jgi:hypothetical protein
LNQYLFTSSVQRESEREIEKPRRLSAANRNKGGHGGLRCWGGACEAAMETEHSDADVCACLGTDDAVPAKKTHQRRPPSDSSRRASLISVVESEIVPRLLLLYGSPGPARTRVGAASTATDPDDVEELVRVLLAHGRETAYEFVEAVRHRGIAYDRICLGLLIPAAHDLAERWERRELSYQELAWGLDALHAVVLEVGGAAESN